MTNQELSWYKPSANSKIEIIHASDYTYIRTTGERNASVIYLLPQEWDLFVKEVKEGKYYLGDLV